MKNRTLDPESAEFCAQCAAGYSGHDDPPHTCVGYKQTLIQQAEKLRAAGLWTMQPIENCPCGKTSDPGHPKRGFCKSAFGGKQ